MGDLYRAIRLRDLHAVEEGIRRSPLNAPHSRDEVSSSSPSLARCINLNGEQSSC